MNLEEFFARKVENNPSLAKEFAQADAELRLAHRTAQYRESQGLTQRQLADRMGVSQPVVGRLERAGRTPGVDSLWRLATALKVHFDIGPDFSVRLYPHSELLLETSVLPGATDIAIEQGYQPSGAVQVKSHRHLPGTVASISTTGIADASPTHSEIQSDTTRGASEIESDSTLVAA